MNVEKNKTVPNTPTQTNITPQIEKWLEDTNGELNKSLCTMSEAVDKGDMKAIAAEIVQTRKVIMGGNDYLARILHNLNNKII